MTTPVTLPSTIDALTVSAELVPDTHWRAVLSGPAGHWYALEELGDNGRELVALPAGAGDHPDDPPRHPSDEPDPNAAGWYSPELPAPGCDNGAMIAALCGDPEPFAELDKKTIRDLTLPIETRRDAFRRHNRRHNPFYEES